MTPVQELIASNRETGGGERFENQDYVIVDKGHGQASQKCE